MISKLQQNKFKKITRYFIKKRSVNRGEKFSIKKGDIEGRVNQMESHSNLVDEVKKE